MPSRVVLTFSSPPPAALASRATTSPGDGELHFSTERPAEMLARLLNELGSRADSVSGVEIREPSLDDLYRHLTAAVPTEAVPARRLPQEADVNG